MLIARPYDDDDPLVQNNLFKSKLKVFESVDKVMQDKDIPEDISLEDLLEKAQVVPQYYLELLKVTKYAKLVVLKRHPSERWINQYNPMILKAWRANMDLQFITDPYPCIMYITSYTMKSERAMSELLIKVAEESRGEDLKSKLRKVGSAFLNNREVSAQEAAYRLLSLPLKRASRKVLSVNTAPKEKRVSMLKPFKVLQDMDDDDDNIFCTSLLDRYASRPDVLDNMSLAEFTATYTTGGRDDRNESSDHIPNVLDGSDDNEAGDDDNDDEETSSRLPKSIALLNGLGYTKKRKRHCVI